MPRKLIQYGLLTLLMIAPVELASWVAGQLLAQRGVVYQPLSSEGYARYLERRDPVLGWPAPDSLDGPLYDARGARRVAGAPDTAPCMAVFGDSFTFGDEVAAEQSYAHGLGEKLGCRVANYGVGGYGTDQAFLRYQDRFDEDAEVVLLAHYTENIIRNVNRYRGFLTGGGFGWKPRFVLGVGGRLVLVPLEAPDAAGLSRYATRPPLPAHEFFVPGGPAGIVVLRFPYSVSMLRLLGMYRVKARLRGIPSVAPFYAADHPSGALAVTTAILSDFVDAARERNQVPVVMMIPDEADLLGARDGQDLPYEPLRAALADRGIETPRLAEGLLAGLSGEAPCSLYLSCGGAHMNARGHAAIASVLSRWLAERGLPSSARPRD